jgi:hypothetical protein
MPDLEAFFAGPGRAGRCACKATHAGGGICEEDADHFVVLGTDVSPLCEPCRIALADALAAASG